MKFSYATFICVALSLALGLGSQTALAKKEAKQTQSQTKAKPKTAEEMWPGLSKSELKFHLALLRATPLYDDPKLAAYVQRLGEKMLEVSPHAGQPYRFLLIDTPIVNASANGTPYIYVNRGLLMLLNSEAQLAGVLAHEIGHNVGRHSARMRGKINRGNILANTASILSGNTNVGKAINVQNAANLRGFGREMELEADGYASAYLYQTKYQPEEMILALSSIADFGSLISGGGPSYHGLFSTHPRTDKRLRAIVADAGELPPGEGFVGREEYRAALDGMVYGPNVRPNAPPGYKRYINESLAITFLYPETWALEIKGSKIAVKNPEETLQLRIAIEKTKDRKKTSEELLKAKYQKGLKEVQRINQGEGRDLGTLGKLSKQRVGLVQVARNTFHFQGFARDRKLTKKEDGVLAGMIANFRRMTPEDKKITEVLKIYYERLEPGETFASLAKDSPSLFGNPEAELRAINGYFPKGEPEPGTWIKKLRKEKVE